MRPAQVGNIALKAVFCACVVYTITHLTQKDNTEARDALNALHSGLHSGVETVQRYVIDTQNTYQSREPIISTIPAGGSVNQAGLTDTYYLGYGPNDGGDLRVKFETAYYEAQGLGNEEGLDSRSRVDAKNNYILSKTSKYIDESYPTGEVTLVTGLWDLGRGGLVKSDFKRPFSQYIDGLKANFLMSPMPKILFLPREFAEQIREFVFEKVVNLRVIPLELDQMEKWYGDAHEDMQKIRTDPKWSDIYGKDGWLAKSPQSTLKNYNTVVMYKIFMLRIAARLNHFDTKSFLFVDAKHMCMDPHRMITKNMGIFKEHMQKFLTTHFFYGPSGETHGFVNAEFMKWLNLPEHSQHKVCRGGVFGGKRESIEMVAAVYENIMRQHLKDGYMGTEENVFSISLYRYPQLFMAMNNDNACVESTSQDKTCEGFTNTANFCAIFDWAYHGGPKRDGKRVEYQDRG
ncbi:hypothetical protein SARC_04193 [Sphaeroforma arctica JP610]|uniref:Uncharacterized protein n=1 Tax=Sphaeroforma arctica JP610 TaxID=667725 RepID=A0A0L0G402_9EUKA|nr:hypothetical protein SARC_04193 [Sphaeroforma arctica JP610]KNC83569.1 hypothetical protein SARC_04193 [Sphaeroforma arctica JP610]|eukprot:XP_014157471.1 hypothetical protein SARC_04193 [Sphaeroforma arctica JP610]